MDYGDIATKLVISLIIGAVIGLERESQSHKTLRAKKVPSPGIIGVRSFALITTLGTLAGFLMKDHFSIFVLIAAAFSAILISYYILHSIITKDAGFTTELGILFSFLIGLFLATETFPIQFTLAMSVILVLILSRKSDIQILLRGIHREELHAFISYALIAIAVLPFLPDTGYSLSEIPKIKDLAKLFNWNIDKVLSVEIINPFKLWFIVVAITGIDMLGHVLERIIGAKRGRLLASIVGGFISSTATTIAIAQESKAVKKTVNYLVAAAIFANVASFFPLLILLFVIKGTFLLNAAPVFLATIVSGMVVGFYFLRKGDNGQQKTAVHDIKGIKESEIFALVPALKFAFLFLSVTIITRAGLELFGQAGFLITSSLAALTNTDAVTINIANLVGKTISVSTAVIALILMNAVNLIGKTVYSLLQGKKEFAVKFGISAGIMIFASLTGLLFV